MEAQRQGSDTNFSELVACAIKAKDQSFSPVRVGKRTGLRALGI